MQNRQHPTAVCTEASPPRPRSTLPLWEGGELPITGPVRGTTNLLHRLPSEMVSLWGVPLVGMNCNKQYSALHLNKLDWLFRCQICRFSTSKTLLGVLSVMYPHSNITSFSSHHQSCLVIDDLLPPVQLWAGYSLHLYWPQHSICTRKPKRAQIRTHHYPPCLSATLFLRMILPTSITPNR